MLSLLALAALSPEAGLKPLGFLVGHCWRGEFKPGTADTHCFERAYDGRHIRDRHQVTGGYAGETIYSWDGKAGLVTYTYWNSLGGVSRGTMKPAGDRLDFGNEAYTAPDGKAARIATFWRLAGPDSYESVTHSPEIPSINRTVTFRRVAAPVTVAESRLPDGAHVLSHETVVAAPIDKVWAAIATVEGWRTWAAPVARTAEGGLMETSYDPAAAPGSSATIRQQVDARVAPRVFAFRTVKAPQGFPHFDSYARVRSAIELEPLGAGATRVRLTGSGYPDTEAGRQLLSFFRDGNRVSLERLQRSLATGPIDWSKETSSARK
jgi:uncharacterized protein YndB with AHSA1/START domain